MEAEILAHSPLAGKTIGEVEWPEGVALGLLLRGNKVMLPLDGMTIQPKDTMIFLCLSDVVQKAEKLFFCQN